MHVKPPIIPLLTHRPQPSTPPDGQPPAAAPLFPCAATSLVPHSPLACSRHQESFPPSSSASPDPLSPLPPPVSERTAGATRGHRAMAWGACTAAAAALLLLLLAAAAAAAGGNGGVHGLHLDEGRGSRSRRALQGRQRHHHLRSRAVGGATVLELRRHGGFSSAPASNREEEVDGLLSTDAARVSSLQRRIDRYRPIASATEAAVAVAVAVAVAASKAQVPVTSGAKLRTLNYVATVGLGGGEATVIVDTASELTWVQCEPCESCHDQQDPLFDPSSSPSYAAVPCNSSSCDALQLATGVPAACGAGAGGQDPCSYTLSYRDGSYSRGVLAHDRLSLAGEVIDGFVFGCGTSNQGPPFGGTSGLMGLGRSQLSLVSQTMDQFGGVFSYCLPLKESDSSGSLVLGDDSSVYRNSTPIVYTSMVTDPLQGPFYFVNLTGITVGGQEVESSGFSASGGKAIIDSGTVITSLVPSIYNAVKAEFLSQLAEYPQAPGFSILDTCFNMSGFREVQVPSLKLVFDGGVEVEVDSGGVLYFVSSDSSQVCLAMASLKSEYETSIIGNYQQKNLRVIFDTSGSQVGFAQETCGYI